MIRHLLQLALPLAILSISVSALGSCGNDAPPTGSAVHNRDSMAVMETYGVSKVISDSGVMRYKVIAEEWRVFDKTKPARQEFQKGLFLERYNNNFHVDLYMTADTAFCYDQNLWELRGRVFIKNMEKGITVSTQKLYWDMGRHEIFSDVFTHLITPDRDIKGNWFRSNESMTEFHIKQTSGYMPMPEDNGGSADEAATTEEVEEDTTTVVRPREIPIKKKENPQPVTP